MGTSHLGNHFPDHLVNNGVTTSNKKDVASLFNNFFTNIGPELSKYITVPNYDYLENRNKHNLFLTPVNEEEVICVVKICLHVYSSH